MLVRFFFFAVCFVSNVAFASDNLAECSSDIKANVSMLQAKWGQNVALTVKTAPKNCGACELTFLNFQNPRFNSLVESLLQKNTLDLLSIKTNPESVDDFCLEQIAKNNADRQYDYELRYTEELIYLDKHTLSVSQRFYEYTGGAHGLHGIEKTSFNLNTGKPYQLEEILEKNKLTPILTLAKKRFIQNQKLDPKKSWKDQNYWFNKSDALKVQKIWLLDDGFYLPNNYSVDNKGITFIYQHYEVTSYSVGEPEFMLTWQELSPFLKPEGIGHYYLEQSLHDHK